jgi:hypothetical protein
MDQIIKHLIENWQWYLLGFTALEKFVRATKWKADDILFDMILVPIKNHFVKLFIDPTSINKKK